MNKTIAGLAAEVEASLTLDDALADRLVVAIRDLTGALDFDRDSLASTDRILALIYQVRPGWSVSAKGFAHEPNGHWRSTLRRSDTRDNDEYVGVGHGPNLPHAMLVALLNVLAFGS